LNERRMRADAVAAAPDDVFYAEPLLDLLLGRAGDYREALAIGEKIRARQPNNVLATEQVGEAYLLLGDYAAAERYLRQAIDTDRTMARAHFALAWTLQQQRRYDEAIRESEAALTLEPFDTKSHWLLAGLYYRQRRYHDVVQVSARARRFGAQNADMYVLLCSAYYELNALSEYQACVPQLLARYTGGVIGLPSVPEALRTLGLPPR
jgi:tetratricopeptide (TPR) repeat protein